MEYKKSRLKKCTNITSKIWFTNKCHNLFKVQRRPSYCLATVVFRGTPITDHCQTKHKFQQEQCDQTITDGRVFFYFVCLSLVIDPFFSIIPKTWCLSFSKWLFIFYLLLPSVRNQSITYCKFWGKMKLRKCSIYWKCKYEKILGASDGMGWVEALAEGLVDMDKMSLYVVEDTYSQDLSVISSLGYPAHRHGEVFCRCMEVWQSIKNIEKNIYYY